jgi:rRNA methylases
MPTIFLESKDNPKIKHLRGLIEQNSYRKKQGQTVLEGTHLCLAWLHENKKINSIFTTEHALAHPDFDIILNKYTGVVFVIGESLYKDLSTLGTSIACMAIVDIPSSSQALDFTADTLILENVQDPGNVGTLLRSAAAAGIDQVICTKGSASIWSPRYYVQVWARIFLCKLLKISHWKTFYRNSRFRYMSPAHIVLAACTAKTCVKPASGFWAMKVKAYLTMPCNMPKR